MQIFLKIPTTTFEKDRIIPQHEDAKLPELQKCDLLVAEGRLWTWSYVEYNLDAFDTPSATIVLSEAQPTKKELALEKIEKLIEETQKNLKVRRDIAFLSYPDPRHEEIARFTEEELQQLLEKRETIIQEFD